MKRFIGFVTKEFYHIFRDKRTMFILFGMPIAQIMLFGFAITNEINNVNIAVFDKSKDGLTVPDKKASDDAFPQFLGKVLPNYDNERIYLSGMKKLASWYTILSDKFDFEALRKALEEEENESIQHKESEENEENEHNCNSDSE